VVPAGGPHPSLEALEEARRECATLDWKVQDLVIIPVAELPREFLPGSGPRGRILNCYPS
jgi:hypothetical protein